MRDSFAASESVELAPNGVAGFRRNGWPDCVGMGGRLPPERVAGLRRNQWPDWLGLRTLSHLPIDRSLSRSRPKWSEPRR